MAAEILDGSKRMTIPEVGIETGLIYERIKESSVGEVVTYRELSELIDRDVQYEARSCLYTAQKRAMREDRMVFEVVRNVGIKRLDDSGIVGTGAVSIKRMRRAAHTGIKKLSCIENYDSLSDEEKTRHNTDMSILGAFKMIAKPSNIKRVESKVRETHDKINIGNVIEAFNK